ncbi:hypothetical protein LOZ53_005885 [Ophidiomyces ophidiicola]|nr:hypothetical protein LOZ55_001877 [Ophidiomyces ophidiicola]KAI1983406.1 hypothetical protein LOZ53_005885 [Ophidiomyces ophidiicola]KAI1986203.1 hypothetical protein LOZ51_006172 [Ophidiomyces ophidiicola]
MAPLANQSRIKYTPVQSEDNGVLDGRPPSPSNSATTSNGEVIYTPSVSDSHSVTKKEAVAEEDYASESDVLLDSPPPEYQDVVGASGTPVEVKKGEENPPGAANDDAEAGCRKARRRGCCGRIRERPRHCRSAKKRICFIIFKVFFVLALVGLVVQLVCQNKKKQHHQHHNDHLGQDSSTNNREILIHKSSDGIWGRYPLYDLLSLSTRSGSIAVEVIPQPADPNDPAKPAKLILNTRSGSISVHFRTPGSDSWHGKHHGGFRGTFKHEFERFKKEMKSAWREIQHMLEHSLDTRSEGEEDSTTSTAAATPIPARPYEIEIHTRSGKITANVAFSSSVHLSAHSGSIDARLTPLVFRDLPTTTANISIATTTRSGSTHLMLAEPLISGTAARTAEVAVAEAVHAAHGSGSVRVSYPRSWAGRVRARSGSGAVRVGGADVFVSATGRREAEGVKKVNERQSARSRWWGSEGMDVEVSGRTSGDVEFWVREEWE